MRRKLTLVRFTCLLLFIITILLLSTGCYEHKYLSPEVMFCDGQERVSEIALTIGDSLLTFRTYGECVWDKPANEIWLGLWITAFTSLDSTEFTTDLTKLEVWFYNTPMVQVFQKQDTSYQLNDESVYKYRVGYKCTASEILSARTADKQVDSNFIMILPNKAFSIRDKNYDLELISAWAEMVNSTSNYPWEYKYNPGYYVQSPFCPITSFSYELAHDDFVTVNIYNLEGILVSTVLDSVYQTADKYEINWDGFANDRTPLPSGIYFVKIDGKWISEAKKMVLMK